MGENYINDLVEMRQLEYQPTFFWLRDFKKYVSDSDNLEGLSFYEQFGTFFNDPIYNELYKNHIVLDEDGVILSSWTTVYFNNLDASEVKELIAVLEDQREVSSKQD